MTVDEKIEHEFQKVWRNNRDLRPEFQIELVADRSGLSITRVYEWLEINWPRMAQAKLKFTNL